MIEDIRSLLKWWQKQKIQSGRISIRNIIIPRDSEAQEPS